MGRKVLLVIGTHSSHLISFLWGSGVMLKEYQLFGFFKVWLSLCYLFLQGKKAKYFSYLALIFTYWQSPIYLFFANYLWNSFLLFCNGFYFFHYNWFTVFCRFLCTPKWPNHTHTHTHTHTLFLTLSSIISG